MPNRWMAVEYQLPAAAQPIDGTDHDIEGQQHQQPLEPPGMVHIEDAQGTEQLVTKGAVCVQISIRILVLGNYGADDGCECQGKQQDNSQLNGTKEFPQWVRVLQ